MKTHIQLLILIILSQIVSCRTDKNRDYDFKQITSISGDLDFLEDGDSISIVLTEFVIGNERTDSVYTAVVKDRKFFFEWSRINCPLTMRVRIPMNRVPDKKQADSFQRAYFTIMPGDKANLCYDEGDFKFEGRNAEKFNCQYSLYKMERKMTDNSVYSSFVDRDANLKAAFTYKDSVDSVLLQYLDTWKGKMSKRAFNIIRLDFSYGSEVIKYWLFNGIKKKGEDVGYSFKDTTSNRVIDSSLHTELRSFPNYLIEKFEYDSCTVAGRKFQLGDCYRFMDKTLSDELREKCLTYLIIKNLKSDSLTKYRNMALNSIENDSYKKLIERMTKKHIEGIDAFDFSLSDKNGKQYSLSDFKGKVVVLDFWFTGCGPCKQMTPYLAKVAKKFKPFPVVFLSVCADRSKKTWLKSVSEGEYTFNNSIKLFTGGRGREHSMIKNYEVRGYPTIILINPEGKMMRKAIDPRLDDGEDLENLIREKI
ncbi:TlpA family protein disulfide reductase [Sinomicrobium kalidii]|uniref:TlpA family protein disulfide reductase n=1 Tax=Sinomicrobium kalidii TaxID=2900738 RepID=UPI001E4C3AD3|nr:TlpA disulfide reductase family protein [Sinomicrobium kalidii]UGU17942.1 TlpA family protein disulfide reductase [Sinomicrobium kalidii]